MINHGIYALPNYPKSRNHLICKTDLPFRITKGEDGFFYLDKDRIEQTYNLFYDKNGNSIDKTDTRWFVDLDKTAASAELKKIFNVMVDEDLDAILNYCKEIYLKSLKMQVENINKEIEFYTK